MLVALAVSSFLVGTLIGATGVGGVLLIPAIMFFGGLGTHEAMATALFSFLFAGIVATASYQRYGTIDWRVTLPVVAGSFLSGYAGAYVGAYVPARGLNILLACLIIFSSLYSMLPARQGTGSYERYASTSALVARVTALYPALTTGRDIFAHLNDPTIKKEVDAWIREVACGIISLIHAFEPALVVLGGGIMGEPYILSQLERMAAPMVKPSFRGCRVVPAALGNNAGLMGAGYLAANIGSGWYPPRSGRTV